MNGEEITEEYLNNLENINSQENLFKMTILHILVIKESPLLSFFLKKCPNPNLQDTSGKSPIFYAKSDSIKFELIKSNASVFIKNGDGKSIYSEDPTILSRYTLNNLKI